MGNKLCIFIGANLVIRYLEQVINSIIKKLNGKQTKQNQYFRKVLGLIVTKRGTKSSMKKTSS